MLDPIFDDIKDGMIADIIDDIANINDDIRDGIIGDILADIDIIDGMRDGIITDVNDIKDGIW